MIVSGEESVMPSAHPPEFRRRAVQLAGCAEQPVARIAKDLGVSESGLRRWMFETDVDIGAKEGVATREPAGGRATQGTR